MNSVENILRSALSEHKNAHFLQAEKKYQQILKLHPNHADANHLLGVTFLQREDYDTAIPHLEQAIRLNPQSAAYRSNLGAAYRSSGKSHDALSHLKIAVELAPDNPGILYNLGNAFSDLEDNSQAVVHFEKSLELDAENPKVWDNYGLALKHLNRVTQAIRAHRQAIRLNSQFPEAYFNLGNALRADESFVEAIEAYRVALDQKANFADAWVNLGHTQEDLGIFDEALQSYESAIEHNPQHIEAHFNLALLRLRLGELTKGWKEYEWRLQKKSHADQWQSHSKITVEDLRKGNILIVAEQGVGDEVMFASCLADLRRLNSNLTLECDARLLQIFRRSFPNTEIVSRGTIRDRTSAFRMIALASLPRLFRNDFSSFPAQKSFLQSDENRSRFWQTQLQELGAGLKVGVSWRGGREPHVQRNRSLALEQWKPILQQQKIHFINLQYGHHEKEIREAEKNCVCQLHRFSEIDPLKELDNYFALISQLDLVISIDNATVHFAGSLGTPVWTMLPFNSDWRWFLNRTETPWYGSMKLYRQQALGDWSSVIPKISNDLLEFTKQNSHP